MLTRDAAAVDYRKPLEHVNFKNVDRRITDAHPCHKQWRTPSGTSDRANSDI